MVGVASATIVDCADYVALVVVVVLDLASEHIARVVAHAVCIAADFVITATCVACVLCGDLC